MRRHVRFTRAALQERHPDLLDLPVFGEEAVPAEQPQDGPPHVLAGQRVDDRVQERVEHGDAQEVVRFEEHGAFLGLAEEVQEQ